MKKSLLHTFKEILAKNLPFVIFRHPNSKEVNLLWQKTNDLVEFNDFSQSGYVFAPFDDKETAYILEPHSILKETLETKALFQEEGYFDELLEDKLQHVQLVSNAVDYINKSNVSKVVISRKEELELLSFDTFDTYIKMLSKYPNAYVYLWNHPKVGRWFGATPETLITVKEKVFKTMALAGTMSFNGNLNPIWGAKELEEQQMVTDFIKSNLQNKVEVLNFDKVETVKAGNLLHLKTNVFGELTNSNSLKKIVNLLHPTPAVCGLPKVESKDYILNNEGYHRSYYTGYLGELNIDKKTALYVNLRCFELVNSKAYIYIGGGVTAASNPLLEWEETVSKSKTIKNIIS
ncbi:chorismate-binding protein [Flavobacteriaceae bacterium]|nr:chorismate-binding protein [Flavobacteriaceae bacterium]